MSDLAIRVEDLSKRYRIGLRERTSAVRSRTGCRGTRRFSAAFGKNVSRYEEEVADPMEELTE